MMISCPRVVLAKGGKARFVCQVMCERRSLFSSLFRGKETLEVCGRVVDTALEVTNNVVKVPCDGVPHLIEIEAEPGTCYVGDQ